MRVTRSGVIPSLLAAAAFLPGAMLIPAPARAAVQADGISQPPMPMADALDRIRTATGAALEYDPDAVRDLIARPVRNAVDAESAARQATAGQPLVVAVENDTILITNDIIVRARRDEAETSLLVRQATTSSRTGQSLRDQPRNSQVISDRLIREQQSLTISDALRNAGGVTVNGAAIQGGATYSVRGFGSTGAQNGLGGSTDVRVGASQPIANVERIEVLKGPDSILIGAFNQGGVINVVTKKPSAEAFLNLETQTGSFGLRRFVLDANNAISGDDKLSARVLFSASDTDRNFGGYRGDNDFLFAPSLRFKDSKTDIVLNATIGEQGFGSAPFAVFDPVAGRFFDLPRDRPVFRLVDQGLTIDTTQFFGEATHQATSWLTLVARAQHQKVELDQAQISPFGVQPPSSAFVSVSRNRQAAVTNAADTYARFDFATGPLTHTLNVGFSYQRTETDNFSRFTSLANPFVDFLAITAPPVPALPGPATQLDLQQEITQKALYSQYLVRFWKLSLLAGVRNNQVDSNANIFFSDVPQRNEERVNSTVPNFGAVLDVTDDVALFGTLAYGYNPTAQVDRNNRRLPDTRTRNIEAGVKIDLFNDRALLNASWFELRQDNLIIQDFSITPPPPDGQFPFRAVAGQFGRGVDINIAGDLAPGWSITAAFTRTSYRPLTPTEFFRVVVGQPRDTYSFYTSYRRPVGEVKLGVAGGLYGRSSAPADFVGEVFSPAARQVDLNWFLDYRAISLNLNLRNLFDRTNYGVAFNPGFFPLAEPRNWRVSLAYRFK